jgi:hypothetical protein
MNLKTENKNFITENIFFKNLNHQRACKIFYQLELFKRTLSVKGEICEFGVFKGNSLNRLILFRDLHKQKKKIYAFDTFKIIKLKKGNLDYKQYNKFLKDSKNYQPSCSDIAKNLKLKKMFSNVKLVKGNVFETLKTQKINKISFVLLDLDLYEPTEYVLKNIWSQLSKNAIILLDNYKVFKGETKAVNEFTKKNKIKIHKEKFHKNFYFLRK